jgi:hypothetical protein
MQGGVKAIVSGTSISVGASLLAIRLIYKDRQQGLGVPLTPTKRIIAAIA